MVTKLSNLIELLNANQTITIVDIDMSEEELANISFIINNKRSKITANIPLPKDKLAKLFSSINKKTIEEEPVKTKVSVTSSSQVKTIYSSKSNRQNISNNLALNEKDEQRKERERREALIAQTGMKRTRRVKCPLTGKLITSEEYQKNKKEGKYSK